MMTKQWRTQDFHQTYTHYKHDQIFIKIFIIFLQKLAVSLSESLGACPGLGTVRSAYVTKHHRMSLVYIGVK
jgi:hypothetical protein